MVQRYGLEVNGGAELLCRLVAQRLSRHHEVEVITTCAKDYITWKDEYSPGREEINGVSVLRFPVDRQRDMRKFSHISEKVFGQAHSEARELEWMKEQGPYSTGLLDYLKGNNDRYDCFIFVTYLYCTTFFGLPLVKDKAILLPTAHDEPPVYLSIFRPIFSLPKAMIFNTEEEKHFVDSMFKSQNTPSRVIGVGIDPPVEIDPESFKRKYGLANYIIYAGRIDESKGCQEMFDYFLRYKRESREDIKLVLLGRAAMKVARDPSIISLGFVSDEDKFNGIAGSRLLIMPSKYESFSIVIMEAWHCRRPVLVNGRSEVLRGHAIRSNGGLWYRSYDEFRECLKLMLSDERLSDKLGQNGRKYVEENYSWDVVESKYRDFLEKLASS
ncbi:MAG TPA: glycosyltransferase family 4 protein [Methanotrichaceae archaeon]|nr:glycosyltransferase family 4 protein [Methanotrichaceae archaeon]